MKSIRIKSPSVINLSIVFFIFIFCAGSANADEREQIVENQLNCLASNFKEGSAIDWDQVCSTAAHQQLAAAKSSSARQIEAAPVYVVKPENPAEPEKTELPDKNQKTETDAEDYREGSGSLADVTFDSDTQPLSKLEFGAESYGFTYKERIGVKDTGTFYGGFINYTKRLARNQPIHSLKDIFSESDSINMFRLEVRGATGWVDYVGSGSWDDIRDINGEIRGIAGYDIPMSKRLRITPYAGLGYRYLFDRLSELPAQTINGTNFLSGYDRESKYFYAPVGMEVESKIFKGWSLQATGEYDIFIQGWQTSHLEDAKDSSGVAAGYDTLKNTQKRGFGLRASMRLTKENSRWDFFVEPYIRYWHIKDSDIKLETLSGLPICGDDGLCSAGQEPDNSTRELGVKLGVRY